MKQAPTSEPRRLGERIRKPSARFWSVLALAACACLIVPPVFLHRSPFRLGLDLQGGTRLVYHFDFEDALKKGQITATEHADKATML